jgi:flavin-dependent dehydrogenase
MKILGAGISGLTTAINLAKEGQDVHIYEKSPSIGAGKENAQLLPNWLSTNATILQDLQNCNIKIKPVSSINKVNLFLSGKKQFTLNSPTPLGYTVLRGGENSFETDLKKQAQELGVTIHTNWNEPIQSDIVATGCQTAKAVIYGKVYNGNFNQSEVSVFLDPITCPGGYAYLYPHSNTRASLIVSKLASRDANLQESMKKLSQSYKSQLDSYNLSWLYDFGAFSGFAIPETAIKDGVIHVGESAGFQDPFLGFGMKYAIQSGHLAAKAILEKKNYDDLWKNEFLLEFKRLLALRSVFFKMEMTGLASISPLIIKKFDIQTAGSLLKSKKVGAGLYLYNKIPSKVLKRAILQLFSHFF